MRVCACTNTHTHSHAHTHDLQVWRAYGYSEHFHPFGLDGEFVCRLGLMHEAQAFFIHKPCVILHQYHPHAYNFSHPPFPWQATCEAYESGQVVCN